MIRYTTAQTTEDLQQILHLQRQNLAATLPEEEIRQQGFVTVVHRLEDLVRMNRIEPHIIAKAAENVIAYLLAMTEASKEDIPVLKPMFAIFQKLSFAGKSLTKYLYMVVGQVCVDKAYRGQGVLDRCYDYYRETFQPRYDFAITETDALNGRSLAAHKRIGFQELHRFHSPDGTEWVIVIWDWNHLAAGA